MTIRDAFKNVFIGYNLSNSTVDNDNGTRYKVLQKESIQNNSIIPAKLVTKTFIKIDEKYFLQPSDIVIYLKKPYRVAAVIPSNNKIVVPNNFAILREIDSDKYNYLFLTYYLEKIITEKYINKSSIGAEDIKKIELPDVSIDEQRKISSLLENINRRTSIYSSIMDNDNKTVDYFINKVLGDTHEE